MYIHTYVFESSHTGTDAGMSIRRVLADYIGSLVSVRNSPSDFKVAFVRAGESVKKIKAKRKAKSLLDCASDWRIQADFDSLQFCFPTEICSTSAYIDKHIILQLSHQIPC